MGGEKWGHLPHVSHTADVPRTNVLVKGTRIIEHGPVRRHAAHKKKDRGADLPSAFGTRQWCGVGVTSGLDGDGGMAGS